MPKSSRLLITGASGFLGGHLCRLAQKNWEVFGMHNLHTEMPLGVEKVQIDVRDRKTLLVALKEIKPNVIIHAAVLQTDDCERHPELAQQVNIDATLHLTEWAARNNCRLIYVSSDMVFDGARGMYKEEDGTEPVNEYGRTKVVAERVVQEFCENAVIVRLPLMYGFPVAGGTCFMVSMLDKLNRNQTVQAYFDQFRTPGLVQNMAEALLEIAAMEFAGVLHVAGSARVSREQLARQAAHYAGLDENLLQGVSMHDHALTAIRPTDVSLDIAKAAAILKTPLLDIDSGLKRMLAETN
jgi:dTDP-4-dehydrorhamnose reductase